jgi:hypothetical protein
MARSSMPARSPSSWHLHGEQCHSEIHPLPFDLYGAASIRKGSSINRDQKLYTIYKEQQQMHKLWCISRCIRLEGKSRCKQPDA